MATTVETRKGDDGLHYIAIAFQFDGKQYTTDALVRTGSNLTVVSTELIDVDTEGLPVVNASIGLENIPVYEIAIEGFSITELKLEQIRKIYVSELPYFKEHAILGCDVLDGLNWSCEAHGNMKISIAEDA